MEELRDFRNQVRIDGGIETKHNEKEGGQQYKRAKEGPRGQKFPYYTPLSTNRERILQEAIAIKIIPTPRKARTPERADQSKHCQYRKNHSHYTEDCIALKYRIEELIQVGHLKRFVRDGAMRSRRSP